MGPLALEPDSAPIAMHDWTSRKTCTGSADVSELAFDTTAGVLNPVVIRRTGKDSNLQPLDELGAGFEPASLFIGQRRH